MGPVARTLAFFAIALAWSWTAWTPVIVMRLRWDEPAGLALWAAGALGPAVAALVLVSRGRHRRSPGEFLASIGRPRVPRGVTLAIIALAAAPYAAAALLTTGRIGLTADVHLGFLAAGLAAGLAEEPGWRGYAQDELQRRSAPLLAMLSVGLVWSAWHLPLFAMPGTYQHGLGIGTPAFWLFLAALLPHAVVYGWLYVASGASIFAVVIFHAMQNAAGELLSVPGAEALEFVLVTLAALALVALTPRLRRAAPRERLAAA